MHFCYLDETGCTGADLNASQQPIFVIGGIAVKDQGWTTTTRKVWELYRHFFSGAVPNGFELHATELINGKGPFHGYSQAERNQFALDVLDLIAHRSHWIHFVGIDKQRLASHAIGTEHAVFDARVPYLLGFNHMVNYLERFTQKELGHTARSMIILDTKDSYQAEIDRITHYRRFEVPQTNRLKWLVEFSYPVDSVRHPMVQLSDLVIFLVRKFLECENGYGHMWSSDAKNFFAKCYDKVLSRTKWSKLVETKTPQERGANKLLKDVQATHRTKWRQHYNL